MTEFTKYKKKSFRKKLLSKMLNGNIRQSALEEFEEQFNYYSEKKGGFFAFIWYWLQVFYLLPAFLKNSIYWSFIMFKNYFISAFRTFKKYRMHTFINITGLALGLAFCILTFLFVRHEFSYDRFHKDIDNIYLALVQKDNHGKSYASSPPILAPTIKENIPEINSAVRVFGWHIQEGTPVKYDNNVLNMSGFYVDPNFTQMFSFPEVLGDSKSALNNPEGIIISKKMAELYFGKEDPLGKSLAVRLRDQNQNFIVTSVIDRPESSSLRFDFLISYEKMWNISSHWGSNNVYTFFKLDKGVKSEQVESKSKEFFKSYFTGLGQKRNAENYSMDLLPLKNLYLNNILQNVFTLKSDPKYSFILAGIALAILIIACVNFLNLSLGLVSTRLKDVGMRKVIGANRTDLIKQYLSESILISLIALLLGLMLTYLILPLFNQIMNRDLAINFKLIFIPVVGFTILVGFLSGIYPSLIVSKFQPVAIFRGRLKFGSKNILSKGLIILQISISIIMIIATLIMTSQMQLLRDKNLGFETDQIVVIDTGGSGVGLSAEERKRLLNVYRQKSVFQDELISVTMSSMKYGNGDYWGTGIMYKENILQCYVYSCDYDYTQTLGMKVLQGRDFSRDFPGDAEQSILVNDKLVKVLGLEDPIGKRIPVDGNSQLAGTIIGVVENSHLRSMHYGIEPSVFHLKEANGYYRYIYVKIKPEDIPQTLKLLQNTWTELIHDRPYVYSFFDQDVDKVFREDERWADVTKYAAFLAIFIACLGAFGLISLTIVRRTKEVGIRKVLGASVPKIVVLLTAEFSIFTIIATVLAWPIIYLIMNKWLHAFIYQVTLSPAYFLVGSLITFFIVISTVGFQVVRAAKTNPVNSLKYE